MPQSVHRTDRFAEGEVLSLFRKMKRANIMFVVLQVVDFQQPNAITI